MANVQNFFDLQNIAKKAYSIKPFKDEWSLLINIARLVIVITACVSMYAGHQYLYNTILPIISSPIASYIFSIIFLIMLEIAVYMLISRFFKYLFRFNAKYFLVILGSFFGACLVYSLSFILSTNGLAERQVKLSDQTITIINKYELKKEKTSIRFNTDLDTLTKYRNKLLSITYKGRQSVEQLAKADSYSKNIITIQQQLSNELNNIELLKNEELAKNKAENNITANKYYWFVAIIMLIQIAANSYVMFAFGQIAAADEQLVLSENLITMEDSIKKLLNNSFYNQIQGYESLIATQINSMYQLPEGNTINNPQNKLPPTPPKKTIGFAIGKSIQNEPIQEIKKIVTNETIINIPTELQTTTNKASEEANPQNKKDYTPQYKYCELCGNQFWALSFKARFCGDKCRSKSHMQKIRKQLKELKLKLKKE